MGKLVSCSGEKGINQEHRKWLRDERDGRWGEKSGEDINQNFQIPDLQQNSNALHKNMEEFGDKAVYKGDLNRKGVVDKSKEGNSHLNSPIGPDTSELDGLELEERKRKRIGPNGNMDSTSPFN